MCASCSSSSTQLYNAVTAQWIWARHRAAALIPTIRTLRETLPLTAAWCVGTSSHRQHSTWSRAEGRSRFRSNYSWHRWQPAAKRQWRSSPQRWSNYSDSDSNLFLKSRIFGFGFDNFLARILFEYSNLFPRISNIWNIFFLLILNLNWEFLGALATCWSHLRALMDKTCAWMWLSLDTFMSFLNILSQFLLSAFNFPHYVQI